MKIPNLLIILAAIAAVLGVISRWNSTFAGRFGIGGDYFLKNALLNSYSYLLILFIIPLFFALTGRLTRRNTLLTLLCGAIATVFPLYLILFNSDGTLGTILLAAGGIGLLAGGLLRYAGKAK
jgi:hypothetical protein